MLTTSFPRFDGDGTAPFIKSIAETMALQGHQVTVLAPYDSLVKPYATKGIEIHRFRYAWNDKSHIMGHARALEADVKLKPLAYLLLPFYLAAAVLNLWRMARKNSYDLLHAHWVLPNGLAAAIVSRFTKLPLLISLHGSDVFLANKNPLFRWITRIIFSQASRVTACSPDLMDIAIQLGAPKNSHVVPYGIDPDRFSPVGGKAGFQHEVDAVIKIGSIGRLVYKKGFDVLIRAFAKIHRIFPKARLVIAGEGPLKKELLDLVETLGIKDLVSLDGQISWDMVPDFLRSLDIFVLPSVRDSYGNIDGLPNVLLEAMSCAKAVVASDIGGARLVIQDKENGLLTPSGDEEQLGKTLQTLLSNPEECSRLGDAARATIQRFFTWDRAVKAMLVVCKTCFDG